MSMYTVLFEMCKENPVFHGMSPVRLILCYLKLIVLIWFLWPAVCYMTLHSCGDCSIDLNSFLCVYFLKSVANVLTFTGNPVKWFGTACIGHCDCVHLVLSSLKSLIQLCWTQHEQLHIFVVSAQCSMQYTMNSPFSHSYLFRVDVH